MSAAALELVSRPSRTGDRPVPPADLTAEQAEEWQAIVARCPVDWFPRETYPLLAQYCRSAVSLRWLAKLRDRLEQANRFNLEEYVEVSKLIRGEAAVIASLATKMRLSQHASYDRKKAKGPTIPAPWED